MSKYGEMIDSGVNLDKVNVYNFFTYYLDNPMLEKIKDVNGFTLFGCKVRSMLKKDNKYIFALIKSVKVSGITSISLQDLEWDILQTRTIEDLYNIPTHVYRSKSDEIANSQINISKKEDKQYVYTSPTYHNILITLVFSKNQTRTYSDKGTLGLAIDNFNTIISFI